MKQFSTRRILQAATTATTAVALAALTITAAPPTPTSPHVTVAQAADNDLPPAIRLNPADAALVDVTSATVLTVPDQSPFNAIQPGTAVIAPTGNGAIIRRVTKVEHDGKTLRLIGPEVGILEVAQDLDAHLKWTEADIVSAAPVKATTDNGGEVLFTKAVSVGTSMTSSWKKSVTIGDPAAAHVTGTVALDNKLDLRLDVTGGVMPVRIEALATANLSSTLRADLVANAPFATTKEFALGNTKLGCKPLPYGLGLICPELDYSIVLDVNAAAGGNAWASYNANYGAQMKVSNGAITTGMAPGANNNTIQKGWNWQANMTAKVTPLVETEFHYMNYTGPSLGVDVGPFVKLTADTAATPWWKINWGINAGFEVDGGDWLDKEYESPLYEIWTSPTPIAQATTSSGSPAPFNGIRLSPASPKVARRGSIDLNATMYPVPTVAPRWQWTVIGGSTYGTINANGLYTAPDRPGYYRVLAKDLNTGKSQSININVIPAVPAAAGTVTATPGLKSATVQAATTNNGGAPVTQVQVRRVGTAYVRTFAPDSTNAYTLSGLPGKTALALEVRFANRAGWGPWKASNTVTTRGPLVVSAPARSGDVGHASDLSADGSVVSYIEGYTTSTGGHGARVMVKNRTTGGVAEASLLPDGTPATNILAQSLSADGKKVAFLPFEYRGVYLRDLVTGVTTLVADPVATDGCYPNAVDYSGTTLVYQCSLNGQGNTIRVLRDGITTVVSAPRSSAYPNNFDLSDSGNVLWWSEYYGTSDPYVSTTRLYRRDLTTGHMNVRTFNDQSTYFKIYAVASSGDGNSYAAVNAAANLQGSVVSGRYNPTGDIIELKNTTALTYPSFNDLGIATTYDGTRIAVMASSDPDMYMENPSRVYLIDTVAGWNSTVAACINYNEAAINLTPSEIVFSCRPAANDNGTGLFASTIKELVG